uniref:Homeobox domain-containing protein n=1 Tax=Meloidogyne floridensis TaxID=298350 RepID=A0A915PFC7_9BILA
MSTEQDKDEKIRQLEEQLFNQGKQLEQRDAQIEQRDAQIEQRDAQIEQQRQRIANLVLFIIDNHLSTENVVSGLKLGTNISSTAANSGSSINIVNTWSMNPQQFSDYGVCSVKQTLLEQIHQAECKCQVQMTSQALTTQPISSQNVQNTFGGSSVRQQKNRMTKGYEAILNEYLVQDYLTSHDIEEIRKKINYQLEAPYIRNWFNKKKKEGRGGGEE